LCLPVNQIKFNFLNSWQEYLAFIGDLDILLISLVFSITPPTLNVGLVNIILQEKHEVDLDMSGDTCVNSDENVVFQRIHYASTSIVF
ncbi:hypothetical protein ACJX0J_038596, partial [Zea mays]